MRPFRIFVFLSLALLSPQFRQNVKWKHIRKMYFEAIKWSLGMTGGSTTSHPRPAGSAPGK